METIDLLIDDTNDLLFKIVVEGAGGETKVRFVLERDGMMVSFPGQSTGQGEVKVEIPELKKVLKEGNYDGRLEVITDDRFFEPLKVNVNLKAGVSVSVASVVSVNESKKKSGPITVKASIDQESVVAVKQKPVLVEKKTSPPKPIVPVDKAKADKKEPVSVKAEQRFWDLVRDIIHED